MPSICGWCRRTARRHTRVSCTKCGAHRELELRDNCGVCQSFLYAHVTPTLGDLPALYADLTTLLDDLVAADPSPDHLALATRARQLRAGLRDRAW